MRFIRWFKHKFFGCQWKLLPEYIRKEAGLPEGTYHYCTYCGKVEHAWYLRCSLCKRWYNAVNNTVMFGRVWSEREPERNLIFASLKNSGDRAVCPGFQLVEETKDDYVSIKLDDSRLKTIREKNLCAYFPDSRDITKEAPWAKARECN